MDVCQLISAPSVVWYIYGIYVVYLRYICGISVVYLWYICGISVVSVPSLLPVCNVNMHHVITCCFPDDQVHVCHVCVAENPGLRNWNKVNYEIMGINGCEKCHGVIASLRVMEINEEGSAPGGSLAIYQQNLLDEPFYQPPHSAFM